MTTELSPLCPNYGSRVVQERISVTRVDIIILGMFCLTLEISEPIMSGLVDRDCPTAYVSRDMQLATLAFSDCDEKTVKI